MKTKILVLLGAISFISSISNAQEISLRCRELQGLHEAIAKEGAALTADEANSLPDAIRSDVLDSEGASKYELTIFRGEATPQNVQAVGMLNDVKLDVKSLDGSIHLSTYLDEVGENDISSNLYVDGQALDMNCQ